MTTYAVQVKPGQVWADNDPRHEHRRLIRVVRVTGPSDARPNSARCVAWYEDGPHANRDARDTWIRLDRFRPTATGYRLVSEATS